MAKKRRHMTKYEYNVYQKTHRHTRSFRGDSYEEDGFGHAQYAKSWKESVEKRRKHPQHVQAYSDDFQDEVYDVKIIE